MEKTGRKSIVTKSGLCLAGALIMLAATSPTQAAERHPSQHPEEVFEAMRAAFVPEKARGVRAAYQWHLKSPEGGDWYVVVNDGRLRMGRGTVPRPDVVFVCSGRDWVALSNGTLNGVWAYVTGRLKVRGPHHLARKLDEMFP